MDEITDAVKELETSDLKELLMLKTLSAEYAIMGVLTKKRLVHHQRWSNMPPVLTLIMKLLHCLCQRGGKKWNII